MLKKNLKKVFLSLTIIFAFLLLVNVTFASNTVVQLNEYSNRYKEWLTLPEEERNNTKQPMMFETKYALKSKGVFGTLKTSIIEGISKYSLKDEGGVDIAIKDQKQTGICWAFAIASSLETNLALNNEIFDFSERHMEYSTSKTFTDDINIYGHNRELGNGGNDVIALAYLTRGTGPIEETEMLFENNKTKQSLDYIKNKTTVKKVDEYIFFPDVSGETDEEVKKEFRNMIKEHIIRYGAVTGSMAVPDLGPWTAQEIAEYYNEYYNSANGATYYTGTKTVNHEVSIVGWDDDYAVDNFATNKPQNSGAFIVRNSWGESFGDQGYQYVSYEDSNITMDMSGVVKLSDIDYDNIYVYDELGANSAIVSNYGVNVFDKQEIESEKLTEVGLYFFGATNYEIYVNSVDGTLDNEKFILAQTGTYENDGYGYASIKLDTPIILTGDKFAIKVKWSMVSSVAYVPIEMNDTNPLSSWFDVVTTNSGESYIWSNNIWVDTLDLEITSSGVTVGTNSNVCIKAFTENVEGDETDTIPPTISDVTGNSANWTNQDITLTVDAIDDESGIVGYSFDNGASWQSSNTKIYTQNTNGIIIKVKDNAGNITIYNQTINIDKIDKVVPTITISPNGGSTITNKNVAITIGETGGSGLSSSNVYEYQFGQSITTPPTGQWSSYTSDTPFNIDIEEDEDYYLWIRTITDNAGNKSAETILGYTVSKKFTSADIPNEIDSTTYVINDEQIIYKISSQTTLEDFFENITATEKEKIKILNKNGVQLQNSDIIGTGMKLILDDNTEYELVVTADVNGDGLFTITDMSKVISHRIELNVLTGAYLKAADVNFDSNFTITDVSILVRARVENTKF